MKPNQSAAATTKTSSNRTAHFILQAKGGVGKSFVASLLMQFLLSRSEAVTGYDLDPANPTLHGYKALNVQRPEVRDSNLNVSDVQMRAFMISMLKEAGDSVIDVGASLAAEFQKALRVNCFFDLLRKSGVTVVIHAILSGSGKDLRETAVQIAELADWFPDIQFIVWANKYHSSLIADDGRSYQEFGLVKKLGERIIGFIELDKLDPAVEADVGDMISKRKTLAEVSASDEFDFIQKLRIESHFWLPLEKRISVVVGAFR